MQQIAFLAIVFPLAMCIGCGSQSREGGSREARAQPCDVLRPEKPNWSGDTGPVLIDLDCDGLPDTVRLAWSEGTPRVPELSVTGSWSVRAPLPVEEVPRIAEFGDLNRDGVRDVVGALVSESSVFPIVVLLSRDKLWTAEFQDVQTAREMQFRFGDVGWPPACVDSLMPSISLVGESAVVEIRVGAYQAPGDCSRASRVRLQVDSTTLTVMR